MIGKLAVTNLFRSCGHGNHAVDKFYYNDLECGKNNVIIMLFVYNFVIVIVKLYLKKFTLDSLNY